MIIKGHRMPFLYNGYKEDLLFYFKNNFPIRVKIFYVVI